MSELGQGRNNFASTSFLDIIACRFGAVVLLVLLAKDSPDPSVHDAQAATARLDALVAAPFTHNGNPLDIKQQPPDLMHWLPR